MSQSPLNDKLAFKAALNDRVYKFVEEHEAKLNKKILPKYPHLLVLVLPKEYVYKSTIILPEKSQHKPTYEGVVLRTFTPFWRHIRKEVRHRMYVEGGRDVDVNDEVHLSCQVVASAKVGEHILFQHFVGIPVPYMDYDTHRFRLVSDNDVLGVLEYDNTTQLEDSLDSVIGNATLTKKVIEKFIVVKRDKSSLTTSGIGEYSGE